jgi:hypothetical protein
VSEKWSSETWIWDCTAKKEKVARTKQRQGAQQRSSYFGAHCYSAYPCPICVVEGKTAVPLTDFVVNYVSADDNKQQTPLGKSFLEF